MGRHRLEKDQEYIIKTIATYFNSKPEAIAVIGGFENLLLEHQASQTIVRVVEESHRSHKELMGEIEWLNHIKAAGVSAAAALPFPDGEWLKELNIGDTRLWVGCFEKAKGRMAAKDEYTPELFTQVGKMLGQMHRATKSFKFSKPEYARKPWQVDSYVNSPHINRKQDKEVMDKLQAAINKVESLPKSSNSYGMLHFDFHPGNYFVQQGKVTLFDFDDCTYNYFVNGIAMAIYYVLSMLGNMDERMQRLHQLFPALWEAYQQENELEPEWLQHIPLMLKLRDLELYAALRHMLGYYGLNEAQERSINIYRQRAINDVPFVEGVMPW